MILARIAEYSVELLEVPTGDSSPIDAVSLDGADKASIQCVAAVGDSIFHLEASNDGSNWVEIDSESLAEGANCLFSLPEVSYRWVRILMENNDSGDNSAQFNVLVIGDSN